MTIAFWMALEPAQPPDMGFDPQYFREYTICAADSGGKRGDLVIGYAHADGGVVTLTLDGNIAADGEKEFFKYDHRLWCDFLSHVLSHFGGIVLGLICGGV